MNDSDLEMIEYLKANKGAASYKLANEAIMLLIAIIEKLHKQLKGK